MTKRRQDSNEPRARSVGRRTDTTSLAGLRRAMLSLVRGLILVFCACLLLGCAYTENRARDAADMITVAGEAPAVGAVASVGPVGLGLYLGGGHRDVGGSYGVGLRSGVIGTYEGSEWTCPITTIKSLEPSQDVDRRRGKGYRYVSGLGGREAWFNMGQVEVAVGVGAGVRAGINVCEIADFILGWAGIDICDDDIAFSEGPPAPGVP